MASWTAVEPSKEVEIESPQFLDDEYATAMTFRPQPVTAADAFVRGGRGRLRTLVVCAAPLGTGMPLDLRREWTLLRRHAEESRVPVTLFRLLPPTPEAFTRTRALHSTLPVSSYTIISARATGRTRLIQSLVER